MNYRVVKDLDADLPGPDETDQRVTLRGSHASGKISLADDLGVNTVQNTASHHQFEDVAWADTETIAINDPDVDPEEAAESLRYRLGTQVNVKGNELTVHLLSAKIRRRLQALLDEWLGNNAVHSDNSYQEAA